ncbi:hypothetical protein [Paracnuella aquatica]|uniref:hypothetical protein n=1 Tax=Paracnuella aquatica TaxID=2268757 RepID=UPI000F4EA735|nr:hypothetical protein [Paracnuella aquatica]RPD51771.1 hypothetical protein DRJ53_03575 [Paracnuella aquatica]
MKQVFTLLIALISFSFFASAQKDSSATKKVLRNKMTEVNNDPKTAARAAKADVLLVPSRKWTSGRPQIPAKYTLGPAPAAKPKQ